MTEQLTASARESMLEEAIEEYNAKGFIVEQRSDYSAVMVKVPKFSWGWFITWTIFTLGLGLILYPFYHLGRQMNRPKVWIQVTRDGEVKTSKKAF
jgi:hypothetical protein